MKKTAFLFPGQGAQYVGMAKDFYEQFPVSKEVFETASKVSGLDIPALCFEENEQINITEYTQIAMLTAEIAMLKAIGEAGIRADLTAGLSLGEYGAIAAAGVMETADVLRLIRKRGIYMQEAVPQGGAMTAVLGLDTGVIEQICRDTAGTVSIANYNCPGQIVITGEETAVEQASAELSKAGAKRCVPLKVSGPFHSPLLSEAGQKLGEELKGVTLHEMKIPYLSNVTGDYVTDLSEVKPLLEKQVASSVKWQQSVERMIQDGTEMFIEIGPGKTLSGFMRKINRDVTILNIEKVEDLERVKKEILG